MSADSRTFMAPNGPALIYVDGGDPATMRHLDSPTWTPADLSYVERATLAARLRALAELIDPGSLATYETRQALHLGAERVTHP